MFFGYIVPEVGLEGLDAVATTSNDRLSIRGLLGFRESFSDDIDIDNSLGLEALSGEDG